MADDMNNRSDEETNDETTGVEGWVSRYLWRAVWDAIAGYTVVSFYDVCAPYVPTRPIFVWLLGFFAARFATIAAVLAIGEIIETFGGGNYSLDDIPAPTWPAIVPACIGALVVRAHFPEVVGLRLFGVVALGSFVAELCSYFIVCLLLALVVWVLGRKHD